MSPRILFEKELSELSEDVLQMAEWVEDGYDCLFATLEKKDAETMKRFVRHDRVIGDMQRNIESKCLSLLTRQTPVARDLRTVSAALKVVTDLERIGNHLSDMAELFTRMGLADPSAYSAVMPDMIKETRELIRKAVESFVKHNIELAREAVAADDKIDDCFNRVKLDVVEGLKKDRADADSCVDVLMIAKYLEKIGDHGVNIGEWEIFQETGIMEETRLL